jgi:hypothetical protein
MNQIALLVALGATTGLFGSRQATTYCANGTCSASYYTTTPNNYTAYYTQPRVQAPAPAPVAARVAPVATAPRYAAPAPVAVRPRTAYYAQPTYFYTAAPSCPNGTCYRR